VEKLSKKDIDRLGKRLRLSGQVLSIDDLRALDQFRRGHEQILDAFRSAVANLQLTEGQNFSTRIKTSNTIVEKLMRQTPSGDPLRLSLMRDIAGARLVRTWRRERRVCL
jgi:ppGpp synthetase/RelA/SpoT-type nucleotidyltranferase